MAKKASWEEAWLAVAERHGGQIVRGRRNKLKKVVFPAEPWVVVLDLHTESTGESSTTYTRVRTLYRDRDGFRFRVYRNSIFTGLGKALGMQDLEVGMPEIDRDYVVQSNSLGKVQALLMRREIAQPLMLLRAGVLQAKRYRRRGLREPDWHQLLFETGKTEKQPERIEAMVGLVRGAIRHLAKAGSATHDPPPVEI